MRELIKVARFLPPLWWRVGLAYSIRYLPKEAAMELRSSAFQDNEEIPRKYSRDGQNLSPPLEIQGIPDGTKSLVLIVDDPDAPKGIFNHWLLWNIPPQV